MEHFSLRQNMILTTSFFFARVSTNKVPIFFIHRLGRRRKKWGLSFERISDDVIAQKPMTLFKD
jgi:hypothetical protein